MVFKSPKDTEELSWTKHSIEKMKFYGLSESRIKRILKRPKRVEKGIATGTIAIMQTSDSKRRPHEIWVMYCSVDEKSKTKGKRIRIISTWRYPGVSPVGAQIPIPDEIRSEVEKELQKL